MEFFNKLGKKASKTYQVTKEKASNLTEELKLKGKISDLNDKNKKIYSEIGKKVYDIIISSDGLDPQDFVEYTQEISRNKEKISEIETQILALKNIKICESCGNELDINAEFCSKCGKEQPKIEVKEPEIVKEPETNEENNENNEANNEENNENN